MEDYRAGVVYAAVFNSQGGIEGEPVSPTHAFPWLEEAMGEAAGPDALIADLKGRGARDLRGGDSGGA